MCLEKADTIEFIDVNTGEKKLQIDYCNEFEGAYNNPKTDNCKVCIFSVEEHREPIGTLTFKTNGSKKESKIDVFTWEEIDGEVIVNDYIHLSKRI